MLNEAIRLGEEQLSDLGPDVEEDVRFPVAMAVGDAYQNLGFLYYRLRTEPQRARDYFGKSVETNSGVRRGVGASLAAIDAGRPELSTAQIRELADGRVFTGSEAVRLGLADRAGSLEDAVRCAGRLAGIEGAPRVVRKRPRASLWERLLEERLPGLERTLLRAAPPAWPRLEYRWR